MAGLERLGGGRGRGGATLACVGTAEWLYSVLYSALYMRVVHCTEAGPDQQLIMGDYFSDLPKVSPMSQPRELADPATSSWSAVRARGFSAHDFNTQSGGALRLPFLDSERRSESIFGIQSAPPLCVIWPNVPRLHISNAIMASCGQRYI